jgi:hypothetical protein
MMHSSAAIKAAAFQGGSSWNKPNIQLRETCSWGDLSLTRWSRSSGWATAGDRGIGIEQSGNTSSNSPAEFSPDVAARFLEEYRVRNGQGEGPGDGWRRYVELGVKVLPEPSSAKSSEILC